MTARGFRAKRESANSADKDVRQPGRRAFDMRSCSTGRCLCVVCVCGLILLASAAAGEESSATRPKPKPVARPAAADLERSIQHGARFLFSRQNADGSWGSAASTRPEEVYAPVPDAHLAFRAAVTAMCVSALIEAGPAARGDGPGRRSRRSVALAAFACRSPGVGRRDLQQLDPRLLHRSLGPARSSAISATRTAAASSAT